MIYQYPEVALLIRIDVAGIEFESSVLGPEESLVMASRIPGRRLGPVYQLIKAVPDPRQLIIRVKPKELIERSRISLELVQLIGKDRNSMARLEAFRLLSLGAESTPANDSTTWAMKTYTLKRAAQAFEQLGWEELRLWSEYYAAHLVFFKLNDYVSGIEFARQVEQEAHKAGIGIVELAALQLEGEALMESAASGSGVKAASRFDEAHRVYQRAAVMAEGLGLQLEMSRSIFNDGLIWEQQEDLAHALEQYELALGIAVSAGNTEFANLVRNRAAIVYEMQGSLSGAIEMLDQIGDEDESERLSQAASLVEKGRLLAEAGYFQQAVDALTQSLQLQQAADSGNRQGPTGLLLGQSYYGMGYMDEAVTVLRKAISSTAASGNSTLLGEAFNTLASIGRLKGDTGWMARDREQQAVFLASEQDQADYLFERSLDALEESGSDPETASSMFRRSRQLATGVGDEVLQHRSLLYLCSLAPPGRIDTESICSEQAVRKSVVFLESSGSPVNALEARWLHSIILRGQGQLAQAIDQMSRLVEDMRFYHSVLPGVLGAWFWENRKAVSGDYMSMVLQRSGVNDRAFVDGRQALLVLDSLRAIESPYGSPANSATGLDPQDGSEQIRSLLAKNRQVPEQKFSAAERSQINVWQRLARSSFAAANEPLDTSRLDGLLNQMGAGSALLSYFFSGDGAYVLVGGNKGVQLLELPAAQAIKSKLDEVRTSMGKRDGVSLNPSLESLGARLIAPVESMLPELIYLLPTGPLSGFPFDMLRLQGRHLAEQHRVINVMSTGAMERADMHLDSAVMDLFFLAGYPDTRRDIFDYRQEPSAEIDAITDIFVGPALHIVQGSALGRDEFQDGRFERADFIHLAVPGTVDLEFPGRSRLMLSGSAQRPVRETLQPTDVRRSRFKAKLVVLSGLNMEGAESLRLDHQLGFVSDFLASGARRVIASLWRISDTERAQFFAIFYKNLQDDPDVTSALARTRRAFLTTGGSADYRQWGGFQIYIN